MALDIWAVCGFVQKLSTVLQYLIFFSIFIRSKPNFCWILAFCGLFFAYIWPFCVQFKSIVLLLPRLFWKRILESLFSKEFRIIFQSVKMQKYRQNSTLCKDVPCTADKHRHHDDHNNAFLDVYLHAGSFQVKTSSSFNWIFLIRILNIELSIGGKCQVHFQVDSRSISGPF